METLQKSKKNKLFTLLSHMTVFSLFYLIFNVTVTICDDQLPKKFSDDKEAFIESIIALREASDLSQPPHGQTSFKMPRSQEKKFNNLIKKGLKGSKKVSDDFLEYLHPELKEMYRKNLIEGTEIYWEGIKSENFVNQMRGNERLLKWIKFWEANLKKILDKLGLG